MTFLLAHLSDAHIGPLPKPRGFELAGKRLTGYINWTRGRSRLHDMDVLGQIVADMKAQEPDHIAMTGDIVNLALAAEFAPAQAWIGMLGAPENVSFTPGNHDAYTHGAMPALARAFVRNTGDQTGLVSHYPYLRVRGAVALIGLCSGVPTAPFMASGRIGPEQREAFEALLKQARVDGLARVVLIHHPPHKAGATPGRNLSDARSFEKIIARQGAELILHGHNHRQSVAFLPGPDGRVPVVGVASASAVPGSHAHRAAYHLFAIEMRQGVANISGRARGLLADGGAGELGPLAL